MIWELEPLEYEHAGEDACCSLCNPRNFADYETTCVAVRSAGGNRMYVCRDCVALMSRALRTKKTTHNGKHRERLARANELANKGRRS